MSVPFGPFRRLLERRSWGGPQLAQLLGFSAFTGAVNAERASGQAVAYRCISAKAEALASVRLTVYRWYPDGSRREELNHPLVDILNERFNDPFTAFDARESLSAWADIWGNSFATLETDAAGRIVSVHPCLPGSVGIERLDTGRLRYRHTDATGRQRVLIPEEVLHIRHRTRDGVWGLSPLQVASETLGLALDQLEHATSTMQNGVRPSGALVFPNAVSPEQAKRLAENVARQHGGAGKSGGIMVLDGGADWHPFSFSGKDAEFLDSRKLTNLDVARIYGVPPTVAGITDNATYSNVTQENRAFVARCLLPWARRIEQALMAALLTEEERKTLVIEHDLSGLLRGDIEARFTAYRTGRDGGWLSANEIRRMENLPPIDGGDTYLQPLNMADAAAATPAGSGA